MAKVIGTVVAQTKEFPAKYGKGYTAEFLTEKGKFFVTRFGEPWSEVVGKTISFEFDAKGYNKTYKTYTIKDFELEEDTEIKPVKSEKPVVEEESKEVTKETTQWAEERDIKSELLDLAEDVKEIVLADMQLTEKLTGNTPSADEVLEHISRTRNSIFIETNKSDRSAKIEKRRVNKW